MHSAFTFTIFCSHVLYLTCYLQLSPIYVFLSRMAWNFSHITCVLYTSVSTEQFWRTLICFPLPITLITVFYKTCFVRHLLASHEPRLAKATSWSTIPYAHISATIQQIITNFSAVVTYVKWRQSWKCQFICIWVTMLTKYIILSIRGKVVK